MQFLSSLEIISRREVSVNKLVALTFLVAKVLRNKVNEEIERVIHLTPVGNPAPPRPASLESVISSTRASGVEARAFPSPA